MGERICYEFYKPTDLMYRSHVFRYYCARGFVEKGWKVLDLGCGCGFGCELISGIAGAIIGLDHDQGAIDHAKDCHASSFVQFVRGRAEDFEFPSPADMTIMIESLEHFQEPEEVLKRVRENTLHRIFISVPLGITTDINPHHVTNFANPAKLGQMMEDPDWYLIHNAFQKTYTGEHLMMCWERLYE